MYYEFDKDWVLLKKLTLRGYQLLRQGRVREALSLHILKWSEDKPINPYTVGQLKAEIVDELIKKLYESVEPIYSMEQKILQRWIGLMINGQEVKVEPDRKLFLEIREKYFSFALLYIDHKGNIIQLPEPGGLLDQPLDWILFLLAFKSAFVEKLAQENKKAAKGR